MNPLEFERTPQPENVPAGILGNAVGDTGAKLMDLCRRHPFPHFRGRDDFAKDETSYQAPLDGLDCTSFEDNPTVSPAFSTPGERDKGKTGLRPGHLRIEVVPLTDSLGEMA